MPHIFEAMFTDSGRIEGMGKIKWLSRKVISILLMMGIMVQIIGCGTGENEGKSVEVTVGYFNNVTHAQALYMKANSTLEESFGDNATVKWIAFNAGPAEVEALFAGDIDVGYIGPVPAITANVKSKGDVQILSSATKGGAVLICKAGSNINTVADLDGKTVAIPQIGNTQHLCLLELLSENNLTSTSEGGTVTIAAISNADVANAMDRGDIDAALVPEPWGATLMENGAELVLDYDEIYLEGEYDVAVVVVRKEFMEQHPDIVEGFLDAHLQATEQINSDTESALKTINGELLEATGKSLNDSIIQEAFTRIKVDTELNKEAISGFAKISKEQGFISDVPDEEGMYVTRTQ